MGMNISERVDEVRDCARNIKRFYEKSPADQGPVEIFHEIFGGKNNAGLLWVIDQIVDELAWTNMQKNTVHCKACNAELSLRSDPTGKHKYERDARRKAVVRHFKKVHKP